MSLTCPQCRSERVHVRNYGKRAGGVIGTIAGSAAGLTGALTGAETGAVVGVAAGPAGSLAGAIIGAIVGGTTGCVAGIALGEMIDENVLDNYQCSDCQYVFRLPQRYLLLATACDGTLATTAQFTSVRVVCNNTLAVALANGAGAVKVPHSTSFNPQAVKKQLDISVSGWDSFIYRMKTLSERKVTHQEAQHYVQDLFAEMTSSAALPNDRAMRKILDLFQGNGRGAELASAKGTAYGLLNAVTEFVDHERRTRSADHRLDSAWFGAGATLKQKSLDQALSLVR